MIELTEKQKAAVERIVAEPTRAALVASDTGTGKTFVAVAAAKESSAETVLVIAPPNTCDSWKKSFEQFGFNTDESFFVIDGKHPEYFTSLKAGVPGVYFASRNFVALSGTQKKEKSGKVVRGVRHDWSTIRPDVVIYDEVHAIQNRWSQGFTAIKNMKAHLKIAMSATPAGNSFEGMWTICRWLWPDVRNADGSLLVDNSKWRWVAEWCSVQTNRYTRWKVVGERNPGEWVAQLPCYIRDEADRVPTDVVDIEVNLSERQRELYDKLKEEAFIWLDEHPMSVEIPTTKYMRLRQLSLGEFTIEDDEVVFAEDCKSSKLDAAERILHNHQDEPVLIFTDSARFAKVAAKRLGAELWSGEVSAADRARIKAGFGTDYMRIVATIASIGEGTDGFQKVCSTEIWLSEDLNGILNEQAQGRLNRTGQKAEVITSYRIKARGTADDGTFERLAKERVQRREFLHGR